MTDTNLIDRSGSVKYNSKLVGFLYDLMKEHIPAGFIEQLTLTIEAHSPGVYYSNGWLAQYAHDLACRLVPMCKPDVRRDLVRTQIQAVADGTKTIDEATNAICERLRAFDPIIYED